MKQILVFPVMMAIPAAAAAAPAIPFSDRQIAANMAADERVEGRIDGDFNGDAAIDTAFITTSRNERTVHVMFAVGKTGGAGHAPAGSFKLPPDTLGPVELSVNKDVLVIKDLTGGTTALAATYRFRGEKAEPRMRLIGLDVSSYSRNYAHDGSEMSWNLLTGDIITSQLKRAGNDEAAGYDKVGGKRMRRPIAVIHMDDTPDAEEELIAATPQR
jgi:hypothetical protein